jgi:glycosyltransferase involved in cell wall biosynthesis
METERVHAEENHRHRVIFLAMYAMDRIDRGSTVRIHNVQRALARLADVEYIHGERHDRRKRIRSYLRDGELEGAFGLHVEACTSWCTLEDLQLMNACRRVGVPVFTWVPDAYPMFPETFGDYPLYKRLMVSVLWRLSMWGYMQTSDAIGSQSESFSRLFSYPSHVRRIILQPGANELDVPPISAEANALMYTGNASQPRFGVDLLVKAAERARETVPDLRLLLVCPPTGLPPEELGVGRPWIELLSLQTDEIPALLPQVRVLVNPLRDAPYHRLQIPTKVMDYLGLGRPILTTDLPEIRGAIKDSGAGMLVPDTVDGLAQGIVDLFSTSLDELNQMGANALRSVREKHSWRHRAQQILDTLSELRMAKQEGAS